jgi:WS/DGAT/MGAT family acyltransferase
MSAAQPTSIPLSPEDLAFWYADQPRQRTTMALLMLLDRPPDPRWLRAAAARAADAVPRLRERVVDAPFDLALPRWEEDPTFDLDYHVRRYSLAAAGPEEDAEAALFHTLGPIYERPFDRTRPLWELVEIDRPDGGSALFFRLHHAVADGVGGNSVLAALTDATREGEPLPPPPRKSPGAWPEGHPAQQIGEALSHRAQEDLARSAELARRVLGWARDPRVVVRGARVVGALASDAWHARRSPFRATGRARRLAGFSVPLAELRAAKRALDGSMIDVLLCATAGAFAAWHRSHGSERIDEVLTLVPVNLRPLAEQGPTAGLGNRATALNVRLPLDIPDTILRFREVHRRVEARKNHPVTWAMPDLAPLLTGLPRPLFRRLARSVSGAFDLIATNVPGIPVPRYVAGSEIVAAYPFAPVAPHAPVSIAFYGYRDRLFVGLDADAHSMPDLAAFRHELVREFEATVEAARRLES